MTSPTLLALLKINPNIIDTILPVQEQSLTHLALTLTDPARVPHSTRRAHLTRTNFVHRLPKRIHIIKDGHHVHRLLELDFVHGYVR